MFEDNSCAHPTSKAMDAQPKARSTTTINPGKPTPSSLFLIIVF